jgi:ribose transport system substrate-binding protein
MTSRLTLLAVGATALAAATVAAAAPFGDNPAKAACKSKLKLGFTIPLPDPNYDVIYGMVAKDIKGAHGTSQKTQANLDPNKQIADVQSMVSAGVNVLIVAPVNPQAIQPALNAARKKGVKLVATDVFIGGPYATNVATSPYDAGYDAAQYLKQTVGSGAVAAILAPAFAGPVIAARNTGFVAGAKKFGLNLVEQQTANAFTPDEGAKILGSYKVKYGSTLKGVWIFNDTLALGAPGITDSTFNPAIVGVNGIPPFIQMIQGGKAAATWNLHPEAIAHTLAWAAERAVCGKAMPKTIYVPVTKVDSSNAAEWVAWEKLPALPFTVTLHKKSGKTFVAVGKNP